MHDESIRNTNQGSDADIAAGSGKSAEGGGKHPVILAVDDDAAVLGAVVRDLRSEYRGRYRIYRAASGAEALEVLRDLKRRGEAVALIVADQRMPKMSGIELLGEAIRIFPDVKRVLLTAYADNEVAIRAINEIRLDHYLMKPWDPPETHLYPVIGDLLDDWQATHRAASVGIRLIGYSWSPEGHRLRDFLARNLVPFRWLDLESDPEAARLLEATEARAGKLPLVLFPDGSYLERPSSLEVAHKLGLHTRARAEVYDLIIVGGGPAGLAAAVYGASEGLKTLLVERDAPGGQAGRSANIENYLGFPVGLSGGDLARRAVAQARRFGTEILAPVSALGLETQDGYHTLRLSGGSRVSSRSLLIAAGISYRMLGVPGAERLTGRGIFYGAALSEALAVQDREVFILGGGNSAAQAALYLSRFARSVTLLVRRPSLTGTMARYLITQIEETPNIRVRLNLNLVAVHGESRLEAISVHDVAADALETLPTAALFIFIGATPHTDWLGQSVQRDAQGYILTGPDLAPVGLPRGQGAGREPLWLESSAPGVFVAGDVRHGSIKGVAAAVGEGAMALRLIRQHLGVAALTQPSRGQLVVAPSAVREAATSTAAA